MSIFTLNVLSPLAHLQAEHKVAADALLCDDVLHGAKRGAQVGVEKLSGQQTHRGGHQVVWQGHVCDLKMEKHHTNFKWKDLSAVEKLYPTIVLHWNEKNRLQSTDKHKSSIMHSYLRLGHHRFIWMRWWICLWNTSPQVEYRKSVSTQVQFWGSYSLHL